MKTVLSIDTASSVEATIRLKLGEKEFKTTGKYDRNKAQVVLPIIMKLLKEHGLTIQEVDAVEVNTGPGSFTGLRVGVSIANALGYYVGVPVNGQKIGQLLEPKYT